MQLIKLRKSINLAKKLTNYQLILLMVLLVVFMPFLDIFALEPLVISNINIVKTDRTATVSWITNRQAEALIEYGTSPGNYNRIIKIPLKQNSNTANLTGLLPETSYYLKITASDGLVEVSSFEQVFKTNKFQDTQAPKISDVRVVYTTGTTATIQWITDKPSNSEVEYGKTNTYGLKKTDGARVQMHDITLTGLSPATSYHFKIRSKDANNNTATWYDMDFRTDITNRVDNDDLIIYDIKPISENDLNITENSTIISWRTNKLSSGMVRYGVSPTSLNRTVSADSPRDFQKGVILTGLTHGTVYYFEIEVQDVFNKKIKSVGHSFITKSSVPSGQTGDVFSGQQQYDGTATVLGAKIENIDFEKDFGFYGLYYNLTINDPGMELFRGSEIPNPVVAWKNYWYDQKYFSFSRIDPRIDFGRNFFPVDEGKPGDPFHFAVHWRAVINVPENGNYSYSVTCDDDCWVFINGKMITDLNGVHSAKTDRKEIYFSAGYHKLEIWFAERSRHSSVFSFEPDPRLKFHPLPKGYEIEDIINYKKPVSSDSGVGGPDPVLPQVLGVKTDSSSQSQYVCNPNLGYSKFVALYKTADTPDVWAILENGHKHYITSPQAFAKYQCNWSEVKIISRQVLDRYPNARLVRTPNDSTIHYLFQRPEIQWLRIEIPSPTVFISYENNYWGNVSRVDSSDIQAYPRTKLIKSAANKSVYLLEGNTKRLIKSAEVFDKNNYNWAEIVEINRIHLDSYRDGQIVE